VDFHQVNADAWGVTRQQAKTLLYALLYGAGSKKIAIGMGVPEPEAKQAINQVYAAYPIKELKEALWAVCKRRNGAIFTCMGRRLYYPHINSRDHEKRAKAERQTFNALLQGGAADILKVLTLDVLPGAHAMGAYLAASIHDELLFYCPEEKAEELAVHLNDGFRRPLLSHCPIEGKAKIGRTWLDVH